MVLAISLGLSLLWLSSAPVLAAPILAPDLGNGCSGILYSVPEYADSMDCCAPKWDRPPIDFRFDGSVRRSRLRVRKPVHSMDAEFAEKLSRGYQLMKALPPEDPRSFYQQANIHCAYCDEAYLQRNGKPLQVHESWLFFPFHRWYLYFHERILAKLLQDDSFALPFWNYDHPSGASFPRVFMDYPGLNDSLRDPSHLFPHIVSFRSPCHTLRTCDEPTPEENIRTMHRVMISGARTASLFFGKSYRFGDERMPGGGTAETIVHNHVHVWIGDNKRRWLEDMGTFYSSARDPVFYAHHASLDRLWEEWKAIEDHKEYEDPDYLDSEFVFYNENAELVKVKVRDCVDVKKLGYTYEKVENLWLTPRPSRRVRTPNAVHFATRCTFGDVLQEPCFLRIPRHQHIPLEREEEILVIEGIQVLHSTRPARFDVFVSRPLADACPMLNCTEYAGSFMSVPQLSTGKDGQLSNGKDGGWGRTRRLGIGFIVQDLQLSSEHLLWVVIMPTAPPQYSQVKLVGPVFVEHESINPKPGFHLNILNYVETLENTQRGVL